MFHSYFYSKGEGTDDGDNESNLKGIVPRLGMSLIYINTLLYYFEFEVGFIILMKVEMMKTIEFMTDPWILS
jgi:hypothetical protein